MLSRLNIGSQDLVRESRARRVARGGIGIVPTKPVAPGGEPVASRSMEST